MLAYVYMHDMGWGWGILMTLGWLAVLGLFIGPLVGAVRDRRSDSPRESLDRRLAAGEIDLDTYGRARNRCRIAARSVRPRRHPHPPDHNAHSTPPSAAGSCSLVPHAGHASVSRT